MYLSKEELQHGCSRLGDVAREMWLGRCGLRDVAWEMWPERCGLGDVAWEVPFLRKPRQ